jgi:dTMP kinase
VQLGFFYTSEGTRARGKILFDGKAGLYYLWSPNNCWISGRINLADGTIKSRLAGKFIVLDGPDGCGKSTQVKLFGQWLKKNVVSHELLRDPGTTAIGEKIRQVLLSVEHSAMTTGTEVLLYMAARVQLWHQEIAPALEQGKCVVLDRWLSSTCAYQGWAGGFGIERVIRIAEDCLERPWPDLTVILDVDLETAAKRLNRDLDRMEQKGGGYHQKVRQGFLKLAEQIPGAVIIDATSRIEEVHENVTDQVLSNLTTN